MTFLLWADIETTGLDERKDSILEICIAPAKLEDPFTILSAHTYTLPFARKRRQKFHPIVEAMHEKTGLWKRCADRAAGKATWVGKGWALAPRTLEAVESVLLRELAAIVPPGEEMIIAGFSAHFDLRFIRRHLPRLGSGLNDHKVFDVSAIKLFARSQGWKETRKEDVHRAAADVFDSIAIAKSLAAWFRRPGDTMPWTVSLENLSPDEKAFQATFGKKS